MQDSAKRIASLLRQYRDAHGLSVTQVVSRLKNDYGIEVNEKTLYGYENGVSMPKVTTFIALCTIYNVGNLSSEMGYRTTVSIAGDKCSWSADQYNDFFDSSLLEKIYLLMKWGVPDFTGYLDRLSEALPNDADVANYERLFETFKRLRNDQHDTAFFALEQLALDRPPSVTQQDLDYLRLFRPYLIQLNEDGLRELLHQAENLVGNVRFTTPSFNISSQVS